MTPNISPFLLGSVFVSAAFLIRPGMALVMDVLAYLLFYIGIGFTQPDPVQLLHQSPAKISSDMEIRITASLGVGTLPAGHEGSVAALYAAADHALYEAKRLGRNRVERTEPNPSLTPSDFQRLRRE